jgi:hypothetical protein
MQQIEVVCALGLDSCHFLEEEGYCVEKECNSMCFVICKPSREEEYLMVLEKCFSVFSRKSIVLIDDDIYPYAINEKIVSAKRSFGKRDLFELRKYLIINMDQVVKGKRFFIDCAVTSHLHKEVILKIIKSCHENACLFIELFESSEDISIYKKLVLDSGFPKLKTNLCATKVFFGNMLDGCNFTAFSGSKNNICKIIDGIKSMHNIKLDTILATDNFYSNITNFIPRPFMLF